MTKKNKKVRPEDKIWSTKQRLTIRAILACSFLLLASCGACNRPQPSPQSTTSKLTLTLIGNTGVAPSGFGKGVVEFSPGPQSGDSSCSLVGNSPITCTSSFAQGQMVVLSVLPNESRLESIDGCTVTKCEGCQPGKTTCQLTMNGDKSVTVVFVGLIR